MNINVIENQTNFLVEVDNYKYTIFNDGLLTKEEVLKVVTENQDDIYAMLQSQELENIRKQRQEEFNLFDKYQLTLLWGSLTSQQQQDYITWRNAWLNATTTRVIPQRLDWFKSE